MPSVHFRILLWRMGTKVPLMLLFAVSLRIHQSHLIISLKINGESRVKFFNYKTFLHTNLNFFLSHVTEAHTSVHLHLKSNKATG